MRSKIFLVVACVSTLAFAGSAQELDRKSAFVGKILPDDSAFVVASDLTGDLPGYFTFSLSSEGGNVTGTWLWVNKRQNADGSIEDLGMIEGSISNVSLTAGADGQLVNIERADLRVNQGSGDFSNISGGRGTLNGSIRIGGQFAGAVSLTF